MDQMTDILNMKSWEPRYKSCNPNHSQFRPQLKQRSHWRQLILTQCRMSLILHCLVRLSMLRILMTLHRPQEDCRKKLKCPLKLKELCTRLHHWVLKPARLQTPTKHPKSNSGKDPRPICPHKQIVNYKAIARKRRSQMMTMLPWKPKTLYNQDPGEGSQHIGNNEKKGWSWVRQFFRSQNEF